jgi:hypothetical protein
MYTKGVGARRERHILVVTPTSLSLSISISISLSRVASAQAVDIILHLVARVLLVYRYSSVLFPHMWIS